MGEVINWRTKTKYVDVDTGEEITKEESKRYIKIKTRKHATKYKQTGTIEYTIECKRSGQYRIWE